MPYNTPLGHHTYFYQLHTSNQDGIIHILQKLFPSSRRNQHNHHHDAIPYTRKRIW
jgi:hypothetical protein